VKPLHARLSIPGAKAIGPQSPVVQALDWIATFFADTPSPDIGAESQYDSALIANHLLHLIRGCGLLNGSGFHSAAIALLRPMEDALDCFAAVGLVEGAAAAWKQGNLKPSDAAKKWTGSGAAEKFRPLDTTLPEYRQRLRGQFNPYSHCSRELCLWDLFFNPTARDGTTGSVKGTLDLNTRPLVIDSNGHSIDAFLTAHLLEFIELIKLAYASLLRARGRELARLSMLQTQITSIMERHNEHRCHEVRIPPEIARLKQ
jgi:hypothetical protein